MVFFDEEFKPLRGSSFACLVDRRNYPRPVSGNGRFELENNYSAGQRAGIALAW